MYEFKEKGQGILEYAMLLIFIAFVVIVVLVLLGPAVGNLYSNIYNNWPEETFNHLLLAFV